MPTALGIDIGTSGVKATVVGGSGVIYGRAYRDYPILTPRPGWAELDPRTVLKAVRVAVGEAIAAASVVPDAVGVSSAGEAFIPLDKQGRPLANAIVSFDQRSLAIYQSLLDTVGRGRFEAMAKQRPLPHYAVFKWRWLQESDPKTYERTATLVSLGGFIAAALGGRPTLAESLAVRTLLYDPDRHAWCSELIESAGLDGSRLPDVQASTATCGEVGPAAARTWGLQAGAPIIVGGLDQACAAHGAGIANGVAMLSLGTTVVLCRMASSRAAIPLEIPSVPHVLPPSWLATAGSPAGGAVLGWLRNLFGIRRGGAREAFASIIGPAAEHRTRVLCIPHLGGSRVAFDDPTATGAFVSMTYGTTRTDLTRAVLDGVAYEIAMLATRFRAAGLAIDRLRAVGGGSRSQPWLQIISDALAIPIESTGSSDVAARGAAYLALKILGPERNRSLDVSPIEFTVEPRPSWVRYHTARLERYQATYQALHGVGLTERIAGPTEEAK